MDPVYRLPNVVWSANRDSPVRENATVQFTELGDLVLYDADGTLVWSTNTTGKSVVSMNLTGSGNLVLLDHRNTEVWRSFDHPTDTLVIGQMLHVGQKLMASTSETNWANGRFYVTVLSDGMYAFAGVDTPLPYYRIHIEGNIKTNTSTYIALKNVSLDVFTSFRGTEASDYHIQLPKDDYGLEFVRIDWDGHLRLYQWSKSSWTSSDVLDITDPCSYPLSCGEYGICSDGQCSCPDAALRQSGVFDYVDPRELNRGCFLRDSLSCGSAHKASFLALPNTTTFNSVFNWTTSEEQCKISCLNDCSCMIAFFHRTNAYSGFCYLAYEIFSMISVNTQSYSRNFSSYAFVKVQEHRIVLSKGKIAIILRLDGINQGEMEFLMEVQTVGSINHIHLVNLIGFCAEKSHRLLVYEYMPNGSLDKWIFAKHQAAPLDWETRLKIIIDVAGGLAYLHSDCRQIIAHLDIKPQNILLDEMFSAKVSDFGLAKLIDREQSTVMTRLRGTPGYLAPKDDRMLDLIDPRSTDMELHLEEVLRVMNLALWCLQVDASRRPSMSMVVKVLEGTMGVETDLDLDLVNIDLMVANRTAHQNAVTLQIESILSGPR
ncbi:hypothetical protein HU200_064823 [Digitaria exilis]|uniref:non-specific serine/threonine protein kinase n=1 Tax=Digitaria exilis TaxID=1010633 RepID=A0A834ZZ90_9POAL|nr:hypothetical protein HU200_064823 [Digitaria exilis]